MAKNKPDFFSAEIISVHREGGDYYIAEIGVKERLAGALPGQFVMVGTKCDVQTSRLLHPFSIYNIENRRGGNRLSIFFAVRGSFTRELAGSRPGDKVMINGALGRGFFERDSYERSLRNLKKNSTRYIMVGGGYGVAPFYFFSRFVLNAGAQASRLALFYGARSKSDLILAPKFKKLGIELFLATEDGSAGEKGFVTSPLERFLKEDAGDRISLLGCGPTGLLESIGRLANERAIPCWLSYEAFFACGTGLCKGCAVADKNENYRLACCEGPVFDSREMTV
ncbi:MAG: dihydroorotate dehydrogenase electron transfer subunit [Myxococcota bacterium]